jgi:hypothetical protein
MTTVVKVRAVPEFVEHLVWHATQLHALGQVRLAQDVTVENVRYLLAFQLD